MTCFKAVILEKKYNEELMRSKFVVTTTMFMKKQSCSDHVHEETNLQ